ncbi:MAG: hypothetical protein R2712_12325 [Vicinamibacterales bacterium]
MIADIAKRLTCCLNGLAWRWLGSGSAWRSDWALTEAERLRLCCIVDVLVAAAMNVDEAVMRDLLKDCDAPADPSEEVASSRASNPRGFWRVDKDKDPEMRHTVLTMVAFADLEDKVRAHGGDRDKGIEAFLAQNEGEGWLLPETLRLADYGLGHDGRARHPQPVASRLGPRFYDWQLTQTAEESWRECELHARNLLGEAGLRAVLDRSEPKAKPEAEPAMPGGPDGRAGKSPKLF